MKWRLAVILTAMAAQIFTLRAAPAISEWAAREQLRKGALVIDVRTVAEFNAAHLTNAINIPLDKLKGKIPNLITNKSDVVLLHCQTGRRSGIAERELRELGYTNAFSIGSFEQARKIVSDGRTRTNQNQLPPELRQSPAR